MSTVSYFDLARIGHSVMPRCLAAAVLGAALHSVGSLGLLFDGIGTAPALFISPHPDDWFLCGARLCLYELQGSWFQITAYYADPVYESDIMLGGVTSAMFLGDVAIDGERMSRCDPLQQLSWIYRSNPYRTI